MSKMFSKTVLVFIVVYFLSDFSYGQKDKKFFRNDYTYIEASESFYKIHTRKQMWAEAKRICALEGASLFYPDDYDEAEAVISFWNSTRPEIEVVFMGMSDILVEGLFETIDGKTASEVYQNWQPGQPDDYYNKQDCACLFPTGAMDDGYCESKYNFICKKSLQSLEWNQQCNIPYLDYTLNNNIGKCYKLHTKPLNWMEAYLVCRAEQSYLAVVNNRREGDYLTSLTESASKQRVGGNYLRGLFHLGFHNRLHDGWQTVRGTPFYDADAWWGKYQPEVDEIEQCGSMFYTGRLTHIDCSMRCFFICEHEVDNWNSTQMIFEELKVLFTETDAERALYRKQAYVPEE